MEKPDDSDSDVLIRKSKKVLSGQIWRPLAQRLTDFSLVNTDTLAKNLRRTQLWSVTVLGCCLLLFTQTFSRLFTSKLTFFSDLFSLHFSPPCFFRSSRPLLFTSLPAANYHRWDLQIATITNQIKPLKLKAQSPFLPRLPLFGFNVV